MPRFSNALLYRGCLIAKNNTEWIARLFPYQLPIPDLFSSEWELC